MAPELTFGPAHAKPSKTGPERAAGENAGEPHPFARSVGGSSCTESRSRYRHVEGKDEKVIASFSARDRRKNTHAF